jgi:hypothetical protein
MGCNILGTVGGHPVITVSELLSTAGLSDFLFSTANTFFPPIVTVRAI